MARQPLGNECSKMQRNSQLSTEDVWCMERGQAGQTCETGQSSKWLQKHSPGAQSWQRQSVIWSPGAPRSVIKTFAMEDVMPGEIIFLGLSELGVDTAGKGWLFELLLQVTESPSDPLATRRLGNIGAWAWSQNLQLLQAWTSSWEELLTHCCPDGSLLRKSVKEAIVWHVFSRVSLRVLPPENEIKRKNCSKWLNKIPPNWRRF